jgi:TPR repeat protein
MGIKVRGSKGTYRYLTFGLLTLLFSTSLAFSAFGGQFEDATAAEMAKSYRRAAEQGVAEAQHNLGHMYRVGFGVPQDYVQAHMWFNLAASRFPASEKKKNRAWAVKNRDNVASMMTPVQIAEAQRLARGWKPKVEGK